MNVLKKITNSNKFIYFVFCVFWTVVLSFATMICDDTGAMRVEGGNLASYWAKTMDYYQNWSSRVLVNFGIFVFTDRMPVYWAIFMGISMFVFLVACSKLFINENKKEECIFLLSMIVIFPYWHISSAGWMSTMGTYFAPLAFGMMSLIPIKKVSKGEKIKLWECICYMLCLIYGANSEQVMVLILGAYGVANVYWLINKKVSIIGIIQLVLSLASAAFVMTCPGNIARRRVEIVDRFPAFDHLNFLGNVELGYETGAHELIYDGNLFYIVACIILAVLIWEKYEDSFIRGLSVIPAVVTIAFGPLRTITEAVYPYTYGASEGIPYWGLVNEENRGGLGPFTQFFIMSMCLVIVLICVYLLCNNWEQAIVALTILAIGIASRVAIGFSPTIYISGIRMNTVLYYCIIFAMCYIFSIRANAQNQENSKSVLYLRKGINILACMSVLNFVFVVANQFRR